MGFSQRIRTKKPLKYTRRKEIKFHKYQNKSIKFLIKNFFAGLFLAPGLGKTLIFLEAFRILKNRGEVDKALVVAKLRIIHTTWPKEIRKWGFNFKVCVLQGYNKEKMFEKDADIYLINKDGVKWLRSKFKKIEARKRFNRCMFCSDESTAFKNTGSKRFRAIKPLLKIFPRRVIMTGSPIPNGFEQLYGQIYLLDIGQSLGEYKTQYLTRYFYPSGYMGYDWKLMDGSEQRIYKAIKHLIIRFGKDELDLPPLINNFVEVILPTKARDIYDEVEKEFISQVESGVITAANAGVANGKLRQIASGYVYLEQEKGEKKKFACIHEEKIGAVKDLVAELQGNPCIIAYQYNHEGSELRKTFPKAPWIGGGVSANEGIDIEDRWNKGELPILLAQSESIAHGLNLQESGTDLIIFTMTWDLEVYEQLYQRLWRQGQKNSVTVHHLVAIDTIDETIIDVVDIKGLTQDGLLEAFEERCKNRSGGILNMSKVIKILMEVSEDAGYAMPEYGKNAAGKKQKDPVKFHILSLLSMISNWSHNNHIKFIEEVTNKDYTVKDLTGLYNKSRSIMLEAFNIEDDGNYGYTTAKNTISMFKKYSKIKFNGVIVDPPINEEEYMSMESKFARGGKGSEMSETKPKKAKEKIKIKVAASIKKAAKKIERKAKEKKEKVKSSKKKSVKKIEHKAKEKVKAKVKVTAIFKKDVKKIEHKDKVEYSLINDFKGRGNRKTAFDIVKKYKTSNEIYDNCESKGINVKDMKGKIRFFIRNGFISES